MKPKFKVWDKVLKQWLVYKPHPKWSVHLYYTQDGSNNSELQWCIDSDDFEVVQYTGLKDKNGVEIFESDKLTWDGWTRIVFWSEEKAAFCLTNNIDDYVFLLSEIMDSRPEIIGNIYENPELLK